MWYRFVFSGRKDIEQQFGDTIYEIVKPIESNLQPIAALFVQKLLQEDPEIISKGVIPQEQIVSIFKKVTELSNRKKINIFINNLHVYIKTKDHDFWFNPQNWIDFAEKIDFLYDILIPSQHIKSEEGLNIPEGQITVKKANNVSDAINFGKGTTWCISQPKNTMYNSYRSRAGSTFYFVFDTTRPEGDPLRRVVVDIQKNNVLLTDLNNETGTISEFGRDEDGYFEYLENNGVDLRQFVNEPFSKQEQTEYEFIKNPVLDFNGFLELSQRAKKLNISDIYEKYIGFGHKLTQSQFEFLAHNNAKHLVEQYIKKGHPLSQESLSLLNNQQKKSYTLARNAMYERYKRIMVNHEDVFQPDWMISELPSVEFEDGIFLNNMFEDNVNPNVLFHIIANLKDQNHNEFIDRLMNKQYSESELNQITSTLLESPGVEVLAKFLNRYPQQLDVIRRRIKYRLWLINDHDILRYLYEKLNQPELFVKYEAERILFGEGSILSTFLENDGYVDELMKQVLILQTDNPQAVEFLLEYYDANLEKAWDFVVSNFAAVPAKKALVVYRRMKEEHPERVQEFLDAPDQKKINQAFNSKKYTIKSGAKHYVV